MTVLLSLHLFIGKLLIEIKTTKHDTFTFIGFLLAFIVLELFQL